MSNPNTIEALIKHRREEYGEAWILASEMARPLKLDEITRVNFLYVVMVILSKLARIAKSPTNIDHWKDIAGYATLVFQYLEEREADVNRAEGQLSRNDDEIPF